MMKPEGTAFLSIELPTHLLEKVSGALPLSILEIIPVGCARCNQLVSLRKETIGLDYKIKGALWTSVNGYGSYARSTVSPSPTLPIGQVLRATLYPVSS